jgi:hypothetical protein
MNSMQDLYNPMSQAEIDSKRIVRKLVSKRRKNQAKRRAEKRKAKHLNETKCRKYTKKERRQYAKDAHELHEDVLYAYRHQDFYEQRKLLISVVERAFTNMIQIPKYKWATLRKLKELLHDEEYDRFRMLLSCDEKFYLFDLVCCPNFLMQQPNIL